MKLDLQSKIKNERSTKAKKSFTRDAAKVWNNGPD
jgi:hypothetical protein